MKNIHYNVTVVLAGDDMHVRMLKILPLLSELNWNVFETLRKSNLDCPRLL